MAAKTSDSEYHVVVVGEGGVGKSAVTVGYISGGSHFVEIYDPTIEDFYRKQTHVDGEVAIVTILDTAGQEQYSCLRETSYREGDGFLMVYSVTDKSSFQRLQEHVKQISRVRDIDNINSVPVVLLGNKCDLENYRQVSKEEGKAFAQSIGATFFEGSAKSFLNVAESFDALVRRIRAVRGPAAAAATPKKVVKKKKTCSIL